MCVEDLPYWCVHLGKKPHNPITGDLAKPNDPTTFGSRPQADQALGGGRYDGLGFLLHESLDTTVIDLDKVIENPGDELPPEVWELITLANTYTEWSPSRTGLHLIFAGTPGIYRNRNSDHTIARAEAYWHERYMTYTGDRLPGTPDEFNDNVRDLTAVLDRLRFEKRESRRQSSPAFEWTGDGLTNDQILSIATRATNGAKVRRLLDGDIGDYPSHSEADLGLVSLLSFYTPHDDQLADLWRSSGLYRSKLDRDDYIQRTIRKARKTQRRLYDPNYGTPTNIADKVTANGEPLGQREDADSARQDTTAEDRDALKAEIQRLTAELEDARETIKTREGVIARERELRKEADAKLEVLRTQKSKAMDVLRNPNLSTGERLTGFALALDLNARVANGEQPKQFGYNVPSIRLAEMTGQSEQTVARQLRDMAKKKLIEKRVVREAVDVTDKDTGEVETGARDRNYIAVDNIIELTERLASYQRPEDAPKHGGVRKPRCSDHPDAGTVKKWHIVCAKPGCGKILDRGETYQEPDEEPDEDAEVSQGKMVSERHVADTSLRGDRLIPEPTPIRDEPASDDPANDDQVQRCKACSVVLSRDEHRLCADCAEVFKRREEEQARRHRERMLHGRRCTQCGEPTGDPKELYCANHRGQRNAGMVAS